MQRFFLPSHPRQRGLPTLRIFVIGAPPNWGGPGIPHRAMTSSRSPSLPSCRLRWPSATIPAHAARCSEIISRMASRLMRQQFAIVAAPEAEGHRPPEEPAAGVLVGLDLRDALVDAIALGSANAAAIVRNCLLIPLPAMSPPKSNRCSLTPRALRLSTTLATAAISAASVINTGTKRDLTDATTSLACARLLARPPSPHFLISSCFSKNSKPKKFSACLRQRLGPTPFGRETNPLSRPAGSASRFISALTWNARFPPRAS